MTYVLICQIYLRFIYLFNVAYLDLNVAVLEFKKNNGIDILHFSSYVYRWFFYGRVFQSIKCIDLCNTVGSLTSVDTEQTAYFHDNCMHVHVLRWDY